MAYKNVLVCCDSDRILVQHCNGVKNESLGVIKKRGFVCRLKAAIKLIVRSRDVVFVERPYCLVSASVCEGLRCYVHRRT